MGSNALAFVLALVVTLAAVLVAHLGGGAIRKLARTGKQSSGIKLAIAICLVFGMVVAITHLRIIGMEFYNSLQNVSRGHRPAQRVRPEEQRWSYLTMRALTFALMCLAGMFRYLAECGDGRFGLAKLERTLKMSARK